VFAALRGLVAKLQDPRKTQAAGVNYSITLSVRSDNAGDAAALASLKYNIGVADGAPVTA
jgi:hypothetical protein